MTKGSRKLLAPVKRTSVMPRLVEVSPEKGTTSGIQGNMAVWSGGECGQPDGGGLQDNHQQKIRTSLIHPCGTIIHATLMGRHMGMEKSVQITQSKKRKR